MEHVPEGQLLWLELPDDDVLAGQLAAAKTAVVRYPFLMARIVDIEPCLEHLCYPQTVTAEFCMAVQDEFAPWNQGVFRVSVQNGKAVVKKEEVAEPAPATTKECPYCKSTIAIAATRCPHCTSEIE